MRRDRLVALASTALEEALLVGMPDTFGARFREKLAKRPKRQRVVCANCGGEDVTLLADFVCPRCDSRAGYVELPKKAKRG